MNCREDVAYDSSVIWFTECKCVVVRGEVVHHSIDFGVSAYPYN